MRGVSAFVFAAVISGAAFGQATNNAVPVFHCPAADMTPARDNPLAPLVQKLQCTLQTLDNKLMLQTDVTTQAEVDKYIAEGKIDRLGGDLNDRDKKITTLQEKLKTLQSGIAALEEKLKASNSGVLGWIKQQLKALGMEGGA
jgi:peptidoglycan hydrolase CwlO-like protein